jgi:hypothetical protein
MLSHDKILSKEKQSGRMSRVRQNSANIQFVKDSVKGISTKLLNQIHCKPSGDTKVKRPTKVNALFVGRDLS